MPGEAPDDELVRFLVREADHAAGPGEPDAVPDWLDDDFWARLADGLVGPDELRKLEALLAENPYVRRRASDIARHWSAELVDRDTADARKGRRVRRLSAYAVAAVLLVGTGAVLGVWFWWAAPRAPSASAELVAARDALDRGDHGRARALAEQVLADTPRTPQIRGQARGLIAETYFRRSRALLERRRYVEAEAEARAGIAAGYATVGLYHVLACSELREPVALALAQLDEAGAGGVATRDLTTTAPTADGRRGIETCKTALEQYPGSAVLWRCLGRACLASRDDAEALAALRKALALDPKDVATHDLVGLACYRQGKYVDAARAFEAALFLSPGAPALHYNLGRAYADWEDEQGNQRLGHSLAHYQRFLELAPDSPLAPKVRVLVSQMRAGGVRPARLDRPKR